MKLISTLALSCALVACGGGGGGSTLSSTVVATPAPAQLSALNAWKSLMTSGGNWSTTGKSSDGASYEITTAIAPAVGASMSDSRDVKSPTAVPPQKPYNMVNLTTTTRRDGKLAGSDTRLLYLDLATFGLPYLVNPAHPSCIPAKSSGLVPVITGLNTSGFLFTGVNNVFTASPPRCADNEFFSNTTYRITWSYESDANLPLFCLNVTSTLSTGVATVESSCFETTAAGAIGSKARLSVTSGTFTLISKNY